MQCPLPCIVHLMKDCAQKSPPTVPFVPCDRQWPHSATFGRAGTKSLEFVFSRVNVFHPANRFRAVYMDRTYIITVARSDESDAATIVLVPNVRSISLLALYLQLRSRIVVLLFYHRARHICDFFGPGTRPPSEKSPIHVSKR